VASRLPSPEIIVVLQQQHLNKAARESLSWRFVQPQAWLEVEKVRHFH